MMPTKFDRWYAPMMFLQDLRDLILKDNMVHFVVDAKEIGVLD